MITICDAIMGSGKTTAAIRYMNEHPNKRFIYITPYKAEADRIQEACPELRFIRPRQQVILYSTELIEQGRNIASTHQAFRLYTPEIRSLISKNRYTLIIDESIELMEELDFSTGDLETCIRAGYVELDGDEVKLIDDSYNGDDENYKRFFSILRCRNLLRYSEGSKVLYYWLLPMDLLNSFEDVIIMTYMFDGQELSGLLKMNNIDYKHIGLSKDEHGVRFSDNLEYIPEYTRYLKDKIHVLDNKKMNAIGEEDFSLSLNWFTKNTNKDTISKLKNNILNFFRNISDSSANDRMWGCYIATKSKLQGKGYTKAFVPFNARAENKYSDKNTLVYALNVYMNVPRKNYLNSNGAEVDDDRYALSTMVQWVWRSSIRNGEDIYIYIPSKRMRLLLIAWMNSLAEGGVGSGN